MSGGYEIDMTSWEAAFDQLYMTFQEKMINEAYQLYTAYKKKEHQKVNKLVQQLKERNIDFKLIVGEGTTTLHLMSFHGNLGMVKLLVEMYGNAEAKDENQQTPLHLACMQGHLDIAQYLYYECGCNLQCEDKDGWMPIELAFFHNQIEIVKYFDVHGQSPKVDLQKLLQGINQLYLLFIAYKKRNLHLVTESNSHLCVINVNFVLKSENCSTTLHFLCKHGVLEGVKNLIEMYGNVEVRDENGKTPLHIACENGHIDVAEYLIYECGCDKEARDNEQNTPLFTACLVGQTDVVKYLISRFGCKIGIKNIMGWTPLHAACAKGYTDIIEYLINQCGCDKEDRDNEQNTPLFTACLVGQTDVVKYLISRFGCKIGIKNIMGWTPLHAACAKGYTDIIEYLINQCGCDKEDRDNELQLTPLFAACLGDQISTVKFLISKFRCKVDARDFIGRTPLHVACCCGSQKIVEYLIKDCGCSPEVTDENIQYTSLHWACSGGHLDTVKYLASECKCNTEARDKLNCTPLCVASLLPHSNINTSTDIITYLILEQGCDPGAETLDGDSPMKYFYQYGQLSMIKLCIKNKRHDPRTWVSHTRPIPPLNLQDDKQQNSLHHTQSSTFVRRSPLYLACTENGSLDVVKFLVEEYGLDPLERVKVIGSDNTEEVLQLFHSTEEDTVLPSAGDEKTKLSTFSRRNPLIQSCESGRLDMLQYLIRKCGSPISHHYHDVLKIIACKFGYNEIIEFLLKYYYTPDTTDDDGNTLLHYAIAGKNLKRAYETVKVLITSVSNLDERNRFGDTALHAVCKLHPCCPDIINLLLSSGCNSQISNIAGKTPLWVTTNSEVFKIFMQYSPADVCERILSDDIDEEQSLELLECLIQQYNWNPNDTTKNGDTALHLACKADRLTTVKYLFSMDDFKYDPYAKNKLNQSPIELTSSKEIIRELIKWGNNPIDVIINPVMDEEQILQLVKEIEKDKLNGTSFNDNTALHLACLTDRTTIVRYLLKESKIDVNAKNVIDISPIQLTKSSEIIIELIRHGANPTDLYSYCRKVLRESKLLQTTVKVFVLGDSNVGKSTLISSLKKEGWFTNWSSTATTVADVAESDHGIIPHDFKSKQCGQITLYDFVGKRLFHESQSDLLHETAHSPRVFIVVTNLSSGVDETVSNLQYWLGFLEEMSSSDSEFKNHTIIAGSNIDKCKRDEMRRIVRFLQKRVSNMPSMDYHDFIALDCRSHSSSGFTKLRRCLTKLCIIARNPQLLAFNAHCFQVYIMDRFKEKAAVSVSEILNKMREEEEGVDENDPLNFLPQSDFQLQNLCIELHNKSQILYLRDLMVYEMDFENSWLVIDKAVIISQLFEEFESITFKNLPSNNGILSFSILSDLELFKVYNSGMLTKFLCHFEYCKEISDQETLQAITNTTHVRLTSDRSFFFPVLVENSAPEGVWDGDAGNFTYHCGWMLQCTKPEQFFTSKFLQTLILRVMFCNTSLGPPGASIPNLLKCSLWKGGIFWGNIFGAETLVEVLPNNKAVLFLMRCRDANLAKCMEHRATIIHQIRKCAKEFCGNLKTSEYLISPSSILKYSIHTMPGLLDLFDVDTLALAVVNVGSLTQPYVFSLTGRNSIPIRDLLKFEPYIELSALMIQEVCNTNNPRYISSLTDDFLLHFSQQIRNNLLFIEIINQILYDDRIMDTNTDNLLSKLMEWRDTCHITYQQLHKCMDRFSIFAELNIVVCSYHYWY